jgi:hypothetical protein
MTPTQNSMKRLQTIVIIGLVIVLLLILASYIYLGMLKARLTATSAQPAPIETPTTVETAPESIDDMPETSTTPAAERLEILNQLDETLPPVEVETVPTDATTGSTVRTPAPTPTPKPASDAVMDQRLQLLEQLEEGE